MLALAMNRQTRILLMQRQMACFAEKRNVTPCEVLGFCRAQAGIGHQFDIGMQPNAVSANALGNGLLRPDAPILRLDDLELRMMLVDPFGTFGDELLVFLRFEAGAAIVGLLPCVDRGEFQRFAISPSRCLPKKLANDDHFAFHGCQRCDFTRCCASENTTIFSLAADFFDLRSRSGRPIGLSPFQIPFDINGRDEVDGLVREVGDGKAPNDRGPECRVIMAAFAALRFRAHFFDKLLGNLTEGMLNQRQALFMPILLLVVDLVRALESRIIVSDAERLLDLPAAERIAHGPIAGAFALEKRERGIRRFGTLQHNLGSNGVTSVGALR
ncbi:hypothetical protein D3C80_710770 [compost metagenome]